MSTTSSTSNASSSPLGTAVSANSAGGNLINVTSIVSQLMSVEQIPLNIMNANIASDQAKLSAYGTIQGALSTFQTAMAGMSSASNYQAIDATSSNTSAVTATATSSATKGYYSISVSSLAQAQQLEATGQASESASIGSGTSTTLTFSLGTISGGTLTNGQYSGASFTPNGSASKTVTIDSSNNSLQGIAAAINNAGVGVSASIVNDGSATPYRLVLTPIPGSANSLKISASPGGDSAITSLLAQDPTGTQNLTQTAAAQNANFTLNGVAVTSSSNTNTTAINGVTLNLQSTTTSPLTVSVTPNTSGDATAIQNFVSAYNALHSTIQTNTAFNSATGTGAILMGDYSILSIQNQIHNVLDTTVGSTGGSIASLADAGVSLQKDGTLSLDTATMNAAISSNPGGIASLFSTVGTASDNLVSFSSSTSSTQPGSYALNVTALATPGSTVGSVNLNTVNDGVDGVGVTAIAAGTTIQVSLNGTSGTVGLAAGNYTATQLAAMIQLSINSSSAFANSSVAATINSSGFLTLTSNIYSSASNITLNNGTGTPVTGALGFMGSPTTGPGTDVAGTIDGQSATGSGQYLTSSSGNSSGLKIQVSGGSTGARGTVNFTQGYAYGLNNLLTSILSTSGPMAAMTTGINNTITSIQNQEAALNVRLAAMQQQYTKQFTALDTTLANMNSTSTYLTQQLANLGK
jgi:flagellar hook-associated protein 2